MADVTEPLDTTHRVSQVLTALVRQVFTDLQKQAATWEPRPMPDDWERPLHVQRQEQGRRDDRNTAA